MPPTVRFVAASARRGVAPVRRSSTLPGVVRTRHGYARAMTEPVAGAPSDNATLTEVLAGLADAGWTESFAAVDGGALRCGRCRKEIEGADLTVDSTRRLEGASDPDDMLLVVAARCPACGAQGCAALAYGPEASAEDSDAVAALDLTG